MADKIKLSEAVRFPNTLAALDKIVTDIQKFCRVFGLVLQVIFIGYYTFSVATDKNGGAMLAVQCIMLGLVTVYFIFDIITGMKKSTEGIKNLRHRIAFIFKHSKHAVRIATVSFAVYEIIVFDVSDMKIVLTTLTAVSILIQLAAELLEIIIKRYLDLIKLGFKMDMEDLEESKLGKAVTKAVDVATNPAASMLEMLDRPMSALSGFLAKKDAVAAEKLPSADEADEIKEELSDGALSDGERKKRELLRSIASEAKEKRDERKAAEKAERDAQKQARVDSALESLKGHTRSIFKKKKRGSDTEDGGGDTAEGANSEKIPETK